MTSLSELELRFNFAVNLELFLCYVLSTNLWTVEAKRSVRKIYKIFHELNVNYLSGFSPSLFVSTSVLRSWFIKRRNKKSQTWIYHTELQLGTVSDWREVKIDRLQLKCDGTRWHTGGEVKGKLENGVGSQYPSHYLETWCIQHYYLWWAHLGCQYSTELMPPADLNGLVRFAERRNLVSTRVPSHFNWPLPLFSGV
jgi:hypothetical protein